MISNVATRVALRPRRSPKWPKTAPPTGRETKAAAKVPIEAIVAIVWLRLGKNTVGNVKAAAVP